LGINRWGGLCIVVSGLLPEQSGCSQGHQKQSEYLDQIVGVAGFRRRLLLRRF
jgi:hypothetical protein